FYIGSITAIATQRVPQMGNFLPEPKTACAKMYVHERHPPPRRNNNMERIIEVKVRDLVAGDKVLAQDGRLAYTVTEVTHDAPDARFARIEWADGGRDLRVWDPEHFDQLVQVARVVA